MHDMPKRKKHDHLLDELEDRLRSQYPHDIFIRNYEYAIDNLFGEVDLLRVRGKTHYFYEVKESVRITKAREQYKRYQAAHPWATVKGIIYSNYGFCRRL